jgi:hypothetical protein
MRMRETALGLCVKFSCIAFVVSCASELHLMSVTCEMLITKYYGSVSLSGGIIMELTSNASVPTTYNSNNKHERILT